MKSERQEISVVSFDPDKIRVIDLDYTKVVVKKTSVVEVQNMLQMKNHINKIGAALNWGGEEYIIRIQNLISWNQDDGTLVTKFFEGENLEIALRREEDIARSEYVALSRSFIFWMQNTGIVWGDAAPRNILINSQTKEICLVDFEKGCLLQDNPYSIDEFNNAVRGIVHEEFSAFLHPDEQLTVFGDVWQIQEDALVPATYLRGKRGRILYERLFGNLQNEIPLQQAVSVQRLMSEIVTPFRTETGIFFPLIYLAESESAEDYVETLLQLRGLDRSLWPTFLLNRS